MEDYEQILYMLDKNTPCLGVFLICINLNSRFMAEIYHSTELFKKFNKQNRLYGIGIAEGRKEANLLLAKIIEEYIVKHGGLEGFKENMLKGL